MREPGAGVMTPVTSQNTGVFVVGSAPIVLADVIVVSLNERTLVSDEHDAYVSAASATAEHANRLAIAAAFSRRSVIASDFRRFMKHPLRS
jgi:hypothetical protein